MGGRRARDQDDRTKALYAMQAIASIYLGGEDLSNAKSTIAAALQGGSPAVARAAVAGYIQNHRGISEEDADKVLATLNALILD